LGIGPVPELAITAAGIAATRNVLRWAGMLDGEREPITGIPVIDPGYPTRRTQAVRCMESCILLHRVDSGDRVQKGDIIADMVDVWGQPVGEGLLRSPYDGFVWVRSHGIYNYPGKTAVGMSIRDEHPLVGPYPEDYFKSNNSKSICRYSYTTG
jgi:predicted deacylase